MASVAGGNDNGVIVILVARLHGQPLQFCTELLAAAIKGATDIRV